MAVPIAVTPVGVSASVLSTIHLGRAGASPRAKRMSGLSIVILRSNFAMLAEGIKEKGKDDSVKIACEWPVIDVR